MMPMRMSAMIGSLKAACTYHAAARYGSPINAATSQRRVRDSPASAPSAPSAVRIGDAMISPVSVRSTELPRPCANTAATAWGPSG